MLRLRWKALRPLRSHDSGGTMLETAFVLGTFLLLLFGIIDLGFLFYSEVTLQNAVRQGARYAVTGNCSSGTCFDPGNGSGDRLNTIINTVVKFSFGLITNSSVTVTCVQGTCPTYSGYGSNNAGGPGDVVKVSATYTWHPIILYRFFTGGSYTYSVSATYKNEIFQPPAS